MVALYKDPKGERIFEKTTKEGTDSTKDKTSIKQSQSLRTMNTKLSASPQPPNVIATIDMSTTPQPQNATSNTVATMNTRMPTSPPKIYVQENNHS